MLRPLARGPCREFRARARRSTRPVFGEEHQVIVRARGEEMLDEIAFVFLGRAFARGHADDAFAAAALRAIRADIGALDKAAVGDA